MNLKKFLGVVGVVVCVLLLIFVGAGLIGWQLFWMSLILMAGFAYFVLPKMRD